MSSRYAEKPANRCLARLGSLQGDTANFMSSTSDYAPDIQLFAIWTFPDDRLS